MFTRLTRYARPALAAVLLPGVLVLALTPTPASGADIGDPITVIQRPLGNLPALVLSGETLRIEAEAPAGTTNWTAGLRHDSGDQHLIITDARHDAATRLWTLQATVPEIAVLGLYDLEVSADGGVYDTARNAVQVLDRFKTSYYFAHITDTHLPGHLFYQDPGSATDTSEEDDLRMVIADLNIVRPEFVLLTGDVVNEGELEDLDERHVYSRAQELLLELEVPLFVTSGNHDLGGWEDTPGPQGSARRNWWRFFGWPRLADPPARAPARTQDYSFDYGDVHFVGLEAYDNYDSWRYEIYGGTSFTTDQLDWLEQDLNAASASAARVLFFHYDFDWQLDATDWGVELRLWGHVHQDVGLESQQPFDLATAAVCDEARAFRLIRVNDGQLDPQPTLSAGWDGERLNVEYSPANDGQSREMSATIDNRHYQRFEHAQVRFLMPAETDAVEVSGGTLLQVEPRGHTAVYVVGIDLQASGSHTVQIRLRPMGDADSDSDTDVDSDADSDTDMDSDADADADGGGSASGGSGCHTTSSLGGFVLAPSMWLLLTAIALRCRCRRKQA